MLSGFLDAAPGQTTVPAGHSPAVGLGRSLKGDPPKTPHKYFPLIYSVLTASIGAIISMYLLLR